jgi:2-polyprenyl-3-methyl-5-hydroxy-6-metoxy-1,4-benzoquinol methylase
MINYSEYTKPLDLKRLEFIYKTVSEKIPKGGKILEIGCGIGNISRQLGHYGYNVTGIDSDPLSIVYATLKNTKSNVQFINKSAEDYAGNENSFDAIICSEVLEHLVSPDSIIKHANKILKGDGIFLVTVPNGRGPRELLITRPVIWLRDNGGFLYPLLLKFKMLLKFKGQTIHSKSDHLDHINFFTLKHLHRMADKNGFKIIKTGKGNFIADVFPVSLISRLSIKFQEFDCRLAEKLPYSFTSIFFTVWVKK